MAKKKKKTKRKKLEPLVFLDGDCAMDLRLSRRLEKEPETLRRLGYRTVDLLMDAGRYRWLSETLALDLARLAGEIVAERVTELIHEVRAQGNKSAGG